MHIWPVQDAKARFSELPDACLEKGPQTVARRGQEAAVLVPIEQWRRLTAGKLTLRELLLADEPRADIPAPPRGWRHHRTAPTFG